VSKFVVLLVSILVFPTTIYADKIRIGVPPDPAHLTLRLAERVGFLKAEDFDSEIIIITGPVAAMVVTSGDLGYFAGLGILRSIIQGLPLTLVACFRPYPHFVLMSRLEIRSLKELKGKTVGVSNFGAGADVIGRMIFKHFGLDPKKTSGLLREDEVKSDWPECNKICSMRRSLRRHRISTGKN